MLNETLVWDQDHTSGFFLFLLYLLCICLSFCSQLFWISLHYPSFIQHTMEFFSVILATHLFLLIVESRPLTFNDMINMFDLRFVTLCLVSVLLLSNTSSCSLFLLLYVCMFFLINLKIYGFFCTYCFKSFNNFLYPPLLLHYLLILYPE